MGQLRWEDTIKWLEEDCGLDASGTETLIRLAASTADEDGNYHNALISFSEPSEVDDLARSVATRIYREV